MRCVGYRQAWEALDGAGRSARAARARHRRHAPARQAPADLAARACRSARSSPATRPMPPTASSRWPAPGRAERAAMTLLEIDGARQALRRRARCSSSVDLDVARRRVRRHRRRIGRRQVDPAQLHRRPRPLSMPARCASTAPTSRALDRAGAALLRREHLGFVFQAFHVLPHLNVAHNVGLPLMLQGRADDARGRGRCSTRSASPASARACRRRCPAASCSGWRSRARWCTGRS